MFGGFTCSTVPSAKCRAARRPISRWSLVTRGTLTSGRETVRSTRGMPRRISAAKELDANVPEELAILSIGNNPLVCENQSVPLSSIDQNLERGGYEAAVLLDKLMSRRSSRLAIEQSNNPNNRTILIPPAGVVTRRSTAVIAVADPMVRKALELIRENLGNPIGSPQIAESLGIRRTELDRLFRTHLLRSVGAEIRRQRLARVKLLLETTDRPISDIARLTGYCTPSHLTNAFKSAFSQSPKDWRRNG